MTFKVWKEKTKPAKKEWAFHSYISDSGDYTTQAVDAVTGEHVAYLWRYSAETCKLNTYEQAAGALHGKGYDTSGLSFDDKGRIEIEK